MSGGHFYANATAILWLAEEMETEADKMQVEGSYFPEIISRMKEAAKQLRKAHQMANAVDYLLSGDDGPADFCEKFDKA